MGSTWKPSSGCSPVSLAISEPDTRTVEAVMARLDDEPVPVPARPAQRAGEALEAFRRILRNRWRLVGVAVAALLALLLAVTPAGAKVREWLGFGAVVVEQQQSAPAGDPAAPAITAPIPAITAPIPPNAAPDGHDMTLDQVVAGSSSRSGYPPRWATRIWSPCPTTPEWCPWSGSRRRGNRSARPDRRRTGAVLREDVLPGRRIHHGQRCRSTVAHPPAPDRHARPGRHRTRRICASVRTVADLAGRGGDPAIGGCERPCRLR